jgi:ferredoxin-type protein NapH
MSLEVNQMVRAGDMEHSECILCGTCADVCPKGVIRMPFRSG